jgi:sugar O-acyltransferase (sialic acid O-acetyltransferase NeuD family)
MSSIDLVIVGGGALPSEFAWVLQDINLFAERAGAEKPWAPLGFVEDVSEKKRHVFEGRVVLGTIEEAAVRLTSRDIAFAVAVGDNATRERLVQRAEAVGWRPATLIHPSVIIAGDAQVGEGSYLAPGCVISPEARVGRHVIVNTHASVGHNGVLEDYSQICPGARVSGFCQVGRHAFLGSNASLSPRVTVGDGAVVGANSHAIQNVAAGITVMGCPARPIGMTPRKTPQQELATEDRQSR